MKHNRTIVCTFSLLFGILLSTSVYGNGNTEINGNDNINGNGNIICRDNSICTNKTNNNDISGIWEQYLLDNYGRWVYVGEFEVARRKGGGFIMISKEQIAYPNLLNSLSIFDVAYNDRLWTFKSNLGNGLIGKFKLQKVSDNVFEGSSLINGQLSGSQNRWVKIN